MKPPSHLPPRGLSTLFRRLCPSEDSLYLWGDLDEIFVDMALTDGVQKARLWYLSQFFSSLPEILWHHLRWRFSMFRNYLKLSMRQLQRHKGYSAINIIGLSMGLAACLLILLWVQYQYSYNGFHKNSDNLYWLRCYQQYGERRVEGWGIPPAVAPALQSEFPEVLNSTRLMNGQIEALFTVGQNKFKDSFQAADPSLFSIFDFPWVKGDTAMLSDDPLITVISESMAEKYFPSGDPIGQTLTMNNEVDFKVVGVMKNIPKNSTLQFDIWIPLTFLNQKIRANFTHTWHNCCFRSYLLMQPGFDLHAFNGKIFNRIREAKPDTKLDAFIYPFKDMYIKAYGVGERVKLISWISLLILLMACINYMNLATARSARRAREVGMRKVSGATRQQIIQQFFGESLALTTLAMLVTLGLTTLSLPAFSKLTGAHITVHHLFNPVMMLILLALIFITGIIAGSYPALMLSTFRPVKVLKGRFETGKSGSLFRRLLVIFQFTISTLLIIGTLVTIEQTRYLKTKDLGFSREQLIYIPIEGNLATNLAPYKQALLQHPGVLHASATSHSPTGVYWNGAGWQWEGRDQNVNPMVTNFYVDEDFTATFDVKVLEGEFFSPKNISAGHYAIINQRFAEIINHDPIIGTKISKGPYRFTVLGVVNDFHFSPATREIGPMIIAGHGAPADLRFLFLKLGTAQLREAIEHIKTTTTQMNPAFPFEYHFLDNDYAKMYLAMDQMGSLYRVFAFIAIFISALGLTGLSSFMAERRTREIGIRRVLGARVSGLLFMMIRSFMKWVLIANVLACPLAYLYLKHWLADFPYRIALTAMPFVIATGLAMLLALISVLFQSSRAALASPAKSLNYE